MVQMQYLPPFKPPEEEFWQLAGLEIFLNWYTSIIHGRSRSKKKKKNQKCICKHQTHSLLRDVEMNAVAEALIMRRRQLHWANQVLYVAKEFEVMNIYHCGRLNLFVDKRTIINQWGKCFFVSWVWLELRGLREEKMPRSHRTQRPLVWKCWHGQRESLKRVGSETGSPEEFSKETVKKKYVWQLVFITIIHMFSSGPRNRKDKGVKFA